MEYIYAWELKCLLKAILEKSKIKHDKFPALSISQIKVLTDVVNNDPLTREILKPAKDGALEQLLSWQTFRSFVADIKDSSKENTQIKLGTKYEKTLFRYCNFKNIEDFRENGIKKLSYIGYCVNPHGEVKDFTFEIVYPSIEATSKGNKNSAKYKVVLQGIHTRTTENELWGEISVFHHCWRAHVENSLHFVDLSFHLGTKDKAELSSLKQTKILTGTVSGIGTNHILFCGECILISKNAEPEEIEMVKQYLNLKRNRFIVDRNSIISKNKITFDNKIPLSKIEHFVNKKYLILSAAARGIYIQSTFEIKGDYTAEITIPSVNIGKKSTQKKPEAFTCRISFENILDDRLLVYALKNETQLYSATVLKISEDSINGENPIIQGAFCVVDQGHNISPGGNIFVMMHDETGENWTTSIYRRKNIETDVTSPIAKILVEKLNENLRKWIRNWEGI